MGVCSPSWAQNTGTGKGQTSVNQQQKKPGGFNALKYSLQHRYKVAGDPFENHRLTDNLYFQVGVGMESISRNGDSFSSGIDARFSVGKLLSAVNSVRLNFEYITNGRFVGKNLTRLGVGVDHLFNLTAYLQGYRPTRRIELSSIEGFTVQQASMTGKSKIGPEIHLGLQLKYHISRNFDFLIEPRVGLSGSGLTFAPVTARSFNTYYGIMAGLRYIIPDATYIDPDAKGHEPSANFYGFSMGAQMPIDGLAGSAPGPSASVNIGRWMVPGFGVRLTATLGTHIWQKSEYVAEDLKEPYPTPYKAHESSSYMGGRAEVLFDPIMFFQQYDLDKKFKMKLAMGGEFGKMHRHNYYMPLNLTYYGLTGGLQFGYRLQEDLMVYVEPRITLANYSVPYEKVEASKRFMDKIVGVNVGFEFGPPLLKKKEVEEAYEGFFEKQLWLSVGGGINAPMMGRRYQDKAYVDYSAAAMVGYNLTEDHAVALKVDATRVSLDMENGYRQFNLFSGAVLYRMDLLSMILGWDPTSRFSTSLQVGPVVSMRMKAKQNSLAQGIHADDKNDPYGDYEHITVEDAEAEAQMKNTFLVGAEVAVDFSYRLDYRWDFYLAPQIRVYGNNLLPGLSGGWNKLVGANIGLRYKF